MAKYKYEFYGDVNGDGKIDSFDAVLVMQYVAGYISLSPTQLEKADANISGSVTSSDAGLILQHEQGVSFSTNMIVKQNI